MLPLFKADTSSRILPLARSSTWDNGPNPVLDSSPVVKAEANPRVRELDAEAPGPHILEIGAAVPISEIETVEPALELEAQRLIAELEGSTMRWWCNVYRGTLLIKQMLCTRIGVAQTISTSFWSLASHMTEGKRHEVSVGWSATKTLINLSFTRSHCALYGAVLYCNLPRHSVQFIVHFSHEVGCPENGTSSYASRWLGSRSASLDRLLAGLNEATGGAPTLEKLHCLGGTDLAWYYI